MATAWTYEIIKHNIFTKIIHEPSTLKFFFQNLRETELYFQHWTTR